jgi:hypothetical protein
MSKYWLKSFGFITKFDKILYLSLINELKLISNQITNKFNETHLSYIITSLFCPFVCLTGYRLAPWRSYRHEIGIIRTSINRKGDAREKFAKKWLVAKTAEKATPMPFLLTSEKVLFWLTKRYSGYKSVIFTLSLKGPTLYLLIISNKRLTNFSKLISSGSFNASSFLIWEKQIQILIHI